MDWVVCILSSQYRSSSRRAVLKLDLDGADKDKAKLAWFKQLRIFQNFEQDLQQLLTILEPFACAVQCPEGLELTLGVKAKAPERQVPWQEVPMHVKDVFGVLQGAAEHMQSTSCQGTCLSGALAFAPGVNVGDVWKFYVAITVVEHDLFKEDTVSFPPALRDEVCSINKTKYPIGRCSVKSGHRA
ncbi:hypothetical protein B0H17DRAFT_1146191 [Mycena rosella]|uniref:Uncharacterized protein n=1 Tax=Mycena rosella TaxID=1033263 RepID=A0AAD7G4S4_MYCRO|nr:hypothetical protein B0H17DRAFT_1146191 [Mycena rosella]